MAMFDDPNINVDKKTNEQNMSIVKSYLSNLADTLNYMEQRLSNVESAITSLQEKGDS